MSEIQKVNKEWQLHPDHSTLAWPAKDFLEASLWTMIYALETANARQGWQQEHEHIRYNFSLALDVAQ